MKDSRKVARGGATPNGKFWVYSDSSVELAVSSMKKQTQLDEQCMPREHVQLRPINTTLINDASLYITYKEL